MSWAVLGATLRRHHEIGLALAFVAMASYELLEMRALESSRASVASLVVHGSAVTGYVPGFSDFDFMVALDGTITVEDSIAIHQRVAADPALPGSFVYRQVSEVLDLRPIAPRWETFGWFAQEINGHDLGQVLDAFRKAAQMRERPSVIVARTRKGYPITDLLSEPNYHGKPLTADEAKRAIALIDNS